MTGKEGIGVSFAACFEPLLFFGACGVAVAREEARRLDGVWLDDETVLGSLSAGARPFRGRFSGEASLATETSSPPSPARDRFGDDGGVRSASS
jgi:hypothetical protein